MKKYSLSKTIALSLGVLAMSLLLSFVVLAWTSPTEAPPGGNAPAPINVSSASQTIAGNLTLHNLYLNSGLGEGDVYNVDEIIGYGDLFLKSNLAETGPVYMAGSELKFYTGGLERMNINSDGEVGINTFKFSPVSTTELGIYDSAGNVILIFDEGL